MKYCPFCGSGLQDAMVFCPKCGKRFLDAFENTEAQESVNLENNNDIDPTPVQASIEARVLDNVAETEPTATRETTPAPKKKTKTGVWVAALLLLMVGVVGFFSMKEPDDAISVTDAANSVLYLEVFDDADAVVATASGFIIEDGTTLVTNYHVIDGAHHIIAYTPDGEASVEIHTILAYDKEADLAVLECESNIGVPPLLLGDSDTVKQGDEIFAVGYPLGVANTLSDGVVSSRYLDEYNVDVLQITAAISSGSSGGALFNDVGQVIGVICASYIDGQNLNLAITSAELAALLESRDSSTQISMKDFYQTFYDATPQEISVYEAISNRNELNGCEVSVHGYISSLEILTYGTPNIHEVHVYLVDSPSEILGNTIMIDDWSTATTEQNRNSDYEDQRWRNRESIRFAQVDGDPLLDVPLEVGMEITVRGALYNFITERIGEDDVVLEPSEYIF